MQMAQTKGQVYKVFAKNVSLEIRVYVTTRNALDFVIKKKMEWPRIFLGLRLDVPYIFCV